MLQVMIRVKNAIRKKVSDIKKIWKRKVVVLYCNTLVGFPGCFGRQLLLEHYGTERTGKKSGKRMVPEAESG